MQKNIAQIRVHKRRSIKYTKKSAAHFCNALFCAQFFWRFIFARFTLRSFFDNLFLQRFILCSIFLTIYFDFDYIFLYI